MTWRKHATALILICYFAAAFLFSIPSTFGALTGDNFVTEITGTWTYLQSVDVDSSGNIFVGANNDILKSTDGGETWTTVLDNGADHNIRPYLLYVADNGNIYTSLWDSRSNYDLYRSTDNGDSWSIVKNNVPMIWYMDEKSDGTLYCNTYDTAGDDLIYNSTDNGATWNVFYNVTGQCKHIHNIQVNEYNDTQIYMATGDAGGYSYRFYDGSWTNLTTEVTALGIWYDSSYVYFGADGHYTCWRLIHGGTWEQREVFFDLLPHHEVANFVWDGAYYDDGEDDFMVFITGDGQVWASWDGLRWAKFADYGSSGSLFSLSRRMPIHFTDRDNDKLYRLDICKEDIVKVFYEQYNTVRGSETNAETFVVEQRIHHGATNYVDFTDVALTSVSASIIGLDRTNYLLREEYIGNAGFEFNNETGWNWLSGVGSYGVASVVPSEKHDGTYSLQYEKDEGDSTHGWFRPRVGVEFEPYNMTRGDILLVSAWVKANVTSSDRVRITFFNHSAGTAEAFELFDVTTSWTRIVSWYILYETSSEQIRVSFHSLNGIDYLSWWDSCQVQILECGIAWDDQINDNEGVQYAEFIPATYFETRTVSTQNPSLTVGGQAVSHSGTLANGTESSATSLSGILTGAVQVTASISGSEQAILKLNGTRVVYEDSIILEGRTGSVCYGRYYGAFAPATSGNHLVLVTNLSVTLSSISDSANKLQFILTAPNATTTISRLYCANRGEPRAIYTVNGTLTWSYNASTKILTLNATHENPTKILIYWKCPADRNNDGVVDVFDLFEICRAYGSTPTCPNWNESCDIDGNETVGIYDLEICAENYGKDE